MFGKSRSVRTVSKRGHSDFMREMYVVKGTEDAVFIWIARCFVGDYKSSRDESSNLGRHHGVLHLLTRVRASAVEAGDHRGARGIGRVLKLTLGK